jgi:plasmid stabilization system protein ParE
LGDYRLGARVEDDLFEIWSYLAAESSPHLADRVEREIFEVFRAIADAPGSGTFAEI